MIKLFYKPYLYYNLYIRNKIHKKGPHIHNLKRICLLIIILKINPLVFMLILVVIIQLNTAIQHLFIIEAGSVNIDLNQTSIDLFNIARKR